MHRPRPRLEYPQAPYLPCFGPILPQPPAIFPPTADWLRRDYEDLYPPRLSHIPTYNHGYRSYPPQPTSHGRDHNFASTSFFSSACNLADISVDQTRAFDHLNFRIPYPTVPSFPSTWTRPEENNNAKVPTQTSPVVTTKFRRSITAPSLGTKTISAEQLTTPEESSDKAVMLKYYQHDEPREPKQRKKRIKKSNSSGSFKKTLARRQTEAELQSDVVTASKKKRQSGSVVSGLEQLKHLGQQIAKAQTRREPIQVCTEQDILTRDESDGTPPLVIDLPDDLLPTNSSHPTSKPRGRRTTPHALKSPEYIGNGLEGSESTGDKKHSSPYDIDKCPPLVIDIPGKSEAREAGQSQPGSSKQTGMKETSTGQQLIGAIQTTEYHQAAQFTELAQATSYWQATESARDTRHSQSSEAVQFPASKYQQVPFMEHEHRTTSGPSSIAATQPSYPGLGPKCTGPTTEDVPSGKYKCIRCIESFPSVHGLLRHRIKCLAKTCVTERLTCTQCNKTFASSKASSDHWKEYHSTERQHVCHKCGRRFPLARALEKHSWTHK